MSGTASVAGRADGNRVARLSGFAEVARRAWRLPLAGHCALLIVVLGVIAPFVHLEETYTSDEGAYAIQARDLADGHWEYSYTGERYDPENRWLPIANANLGKDGWVAYVQHPAFALLMLAGTKVAGGIVGLHLPALAGALGAAVAAWLLAAEVEGAPWARRAAFWLAASGPVVVHAYILWAHALSAAVAGATLLSAVRLARPGRKATPWPPLLGMAVGSAGGVLLRSEGLLFGAALAGGLFLVGLRGRPWWQRLAIPALCLGATLAAAVAEHWWIGAILGKEPEIRGTRYSLEYGEESPSRKGVLDLLSERANGAFHTVLRGAHTEPELAALVLAGLTMVAYAAWAYHRRRPGWERDVAIGILGACAVYLLRAFGAQTQAMTGTLAAWPIALIGLAVLGRPFPPPARLAAVVSTLFLLAVLATQYPTGGGLEWGGRFLAPIYVPVAVLTCIGLGRLAAALPAPPDVRRRVGLGGVVLLAVLPTAIGLVMLHSTRSYSGRLVDEVVAATPGQTGGDRLVLTDVVALPRAAWRTHPGVDWMLVDPSEIDLVTAALAAGGAQKVTVLVSATTADPSTFSAFTVKDVTGPAARASGRRTFQLSAP